MWGKAVQPKKYNNFFLSPLETEFLTWADPEVNWIPKSDELPQEKMGHMNSSLLVECSKKCCHKSG